MKVDDHIVDRVAALAKLNLEGKEKESMKKDMTRILDMCEQLNEVDTTNVEPLVFMTSPIQDLRKDEAHTEISKEEALKNAPERDSDYFKVPKVFDR